MPAPGPYRFSTMATPRDTALPQIDQLLDDDGAARLFARVRGGRRPAALRLERIWYKPRRRVVARYTVGGGEGTSTAVVTLDAKRDLSQTVRRAGECAPVSFDWETGALIEWGGFDLSLPMVGASRSEVDELLQKAGIEAVGH